MKLGVSKNFEGRASSFESALNTDPQRKTVELGDWHVPADDGRTILLELNGIVLSYFYAAGSGSDPSSWITVSFDLVVRYYPHLANQAKDHSFHAAMLDENDQELFNTRIGIFPDQCGRGGPINLREDVDARYFPFATQVIPWANIIRHNDYRRC